MKKATSIFFFDDQMMDHIGPHNDFGECYIQRIKLGKFFLYKFIVILISPQTILFLKMKSSCLTLIVRPFNRELSMLPLEMNYPWYCMYPFCLSYLIRLSRNYRSPADASMNKLMINCNPLIFFYRTIYCLYYPYIS